MIGGGFVTYVEPTVTADVYYVAKDRGIVLKAFDDLGVGWQMVTLEDVIYTRPLNGGWLPERFAVGGLVNAQIVAEGDDLTAFRILSIADLPNKPLIQERKGIVHVEVGA